MRLKDIKDIHISLKDMDKKKAYTAVAVLSAVVVGGLLAFGAAGRYATMKRLSEVKKEDLGKFRDVEEEYLRKRAVLESVAKKAYSGGGAGESAVALVEEFGNRAGVKGLITALKPLDERDVMGYREKGIEIRMERVELNQLVNFLYLAGNHRALFVVKEFSMKSRFEDPNLLDVTIRLAHITRGAGAA